jgi:hypothetical protein
MKFSKHSECLETLEEHTMNQKPDTGTENQKAHPNEPLQKHGETDLGRLGGSEGGSTPSGGAGEPQTTPLEPEKQGGIGGP